MSLLWKDVKVGSRTVSVFHDYPGHHYALNPVTGEVVSGRTHDEVVQMLLMKSLEQTAKELRPILKKLE